MKYNIYFVSFIQDHKLKHMAELQSSVVTDNDTRHQIQSQILTWEENLERLYCERFRLKCYMASLQAGELPNPKVSEPSHYVSVYSWPSSRTFFLTITS